MNASGLLVAGLLVLSTILSGCTSFVDQASEGREGSLSPTPTGPRSVVAVVAEGGVNAYHDFFQVSAAEEPGYAAMAETLGAHVLRLSSEPDLQDAKQADRAKVKSMKRGELYWIDGTRLFVITFENKTEELALITYDPLALDGHGTSVMSHIARTAPNTAIVHVHTLQLGHGESIPPAPGYVMFGQSLIEGMEWTARQPWIDAASLSFGFPGSIPDAHDATPSLRAFWEATKAGRENGRLIVAGAGNQPPPPIATPVAGPPWVVSAGMAHWSEHGDERDSAKVPDFTANTSVWVAERNTRNGTSTFGGTSASAPGLAARVANVLTRLRDDAALSVEDILHRDEGVHIPPGAFGPGSAPIGPAEVQAALNVTATYWTPEDWEPKEDAHPFWTAANASIPVNPLLPALQVGWGYVDADEEQAAYELLKEYALTGDRALLTNPVEKGANTQFMESWYALRSAYWDAKAEN